MAYFNPTKHTELIVDASPVGLEAVLPQKTANSDEPMHVVAYASRTLTDVERRYSQTEREALAIVWGCEHHHLYLYGAPFTLVTDHQPLETIFSNPSSKPSAIGFSDGHYASSPTTSTSSTALAKTIPRTTCRVTRSHAPALARKDRLKFTSTSLPLTQFPRS